MAVEKPSQQRAGFLEIAFKAVQATLATLAVYRAARTALAAWQGVIEMIRGPEQEEEPAVLVEAEEEDG